MLHQKPKYVFIEFSTLESYMVVPSQLIVVVHTAHIGVVQHNWVGKFHYNAGPISLFPWNLILDCGITVGSYYGHRLILPHWNWGSWTALTVLSCCHPCPSFLLSPQVSVHRESPSGWSSPFHTHTDQTFGDQREDQHLWKSCQKIDMAATIHVRSWDARTTLASSPFSVLSPYLPVYTWKLAMYPFEALASAHTPPHWFLGHILL